MVLTNMDPIILGMTRISNRLSAQREMSPACERMPIGNARHTERGPKREEATLEAKVMPSVKLHPTLPLPLWLIPWLQLLVQWWGNISLQGSTQSKATTDRQGITPQTQDLPKAYNKDYPWALHRDLSLLSSQD